MRVTLIYLFTAAVLLSGCAAPQAAPSAPAEPEAAAVTFTDDLGREVSLAPPRRVAALLGSFADIWLLAGGRESLIAAAGDAWTSFDLGLDETVSDLGSLLEPNLEALLAAEPDLVLFSANNRSQVELLEALDRAGIAAACFDVQHVDDYVRMLDICTRLTGQPELFETRGAAVRERVRAAAARQDGSAPCVLCLRFSAAGVRVKGSRDFLLGEMLADLGCRNLADSDASLLESLSLEAILAGDPDYIFAVPQGADTAGADAALRDALLSNPAWAGLRAVREGRFFVLDKALYNLKPNARWGEAYEQLADILYPNAGARPAA